MSRFTTPKPSSYVQGTEMSLDQLYEWFLAMPVHEQIDLLGVLKRLADAGAHCHRMDHVGAVEHFQEQSRKLREDLTKALEKTYRL